MKSLVIAIGLAALFAVPAWAEQYWTTYEADGVYPEEMGWVRSVYGGGAQRSFDNGALVIDSRASSNIEDAYIMERAGQLDPDSGELFLMSWRMRIDDLQGPWDPCVTVFSDQRRAVFLSFSSTGVNVYPPGGFVTTFAPGVFHDFEFRSTDMLTYVLYVDGSLAYSGSFSVPLLTASSVGWGDQTSGGASLTRWDRFSFGVVPEPKSALVGVTLLAVARAVSRGKSR